MDYSYKQRLSALQSEQEQQALKKKKQNEEMTQQRIDSIGNIHKAIQAMLAQQNQIKLSTISDMDNQIHHHNKMYIPLFIFPPTFTENIKTKYAMHC